MVGSAIDLLLGNTEPRVDHAEWIEDALAQELPERHPGHASNQDAEDLGQTLVGPLVAQN